MILKEGIIPDSVWKFAKANTKSMVAAGILALIIWGYMKKNKKESVMSEDLMDWDKLKSTMSLLKLYNRKKDIVVSILKTDKTYYVYVNGVQQDKSFDMQSPLEDDRYTGGSLALAKDYMLQIINKIDGTSENFYSDLSEIRSN